MEYFKRNMQFWWEYFCDSVESSLPLFIVGGIILILVLWMINLARHSKRLHAMGVNTEGVVVSVKDHIANKNPHATMKQYYIKVEYTDDKGKKRRSTCYHLAPLKVGQKIMIRYLPGHYTFVEFRHEDW
jgi:hypothetical protein